MTNLEAYTKYKTISNKEEMLKDIMIDKNTNKSNKINVDVAYLIKNQSRIAYLIMEKYYEKSPESKKDYTSITYKKSIDDLLCTFYFLKLSIDCKDKVIFINYIKWLKDLLVNYNIPISATKRSFESMLEVLEGEGKLDKSIKKLLVEVLENMNIPYKKDIYTCNFEKRQELCEDYLGCILRGDKYRASKLIFDVYSSGDITIEEIYLDVIYPVMNEVGQLWQRNMISVVQEHYCSSVTKSILERISLEIPSKENSKYVYLGACVSKELHEMGGQMVSDLFKLGGFRTYYLGANTPRNGLISFIKQVKVDILGLSATMMIHVEEVKSMIEEIRKDEECNRIKIIVGGYIFNQSPKLWKYVGADGYGKDVSESYRVGCSLIKNF